VWELVCREQAGLRVELRTRQVSSGIGAVSPGLWGGRPTGVPFLLGKWHSNESSLATGEMLTSFAFRLAFEGDVSVARPNELDETDLTGVIHRVRSADLEDSEAIPKRLSRKVLL